MKHSTLENRMNLARNKAKIPEEKLLMGSTKGKYPITLDDGRTIVYISDKSKEEETRAKYASLQNSRYPSRSVR
jgi:hypothetical protein